MSRWFTVDLVVRGAEMPRHLRRVAQLAVAGLAEADREGLDLARCGALIRATIVEESMPAREERAERHVADHLQPDRLVQARQERGDGIAPAPAAQPVGLRSGALQ